MRYREILAAIDKVPYGLRFLLDTDAAQPTVEFHAGRLSMDEFARRVRASGWWQIADMLRRRIRVVV